MVAKNSRSRCEEQDIPFFRFSPTFTEIIAAGETDNEKLLNMVISTKLDLKLKEKELDELVNIFHAVAESSKDIDQEAIPEEAEASDHPHGEETEANGSDDDISKKEAEPAKIQEVVIEEEQELNSQQEVTEDEFVLEQDQELEAANKTPADFKEEDEGIELLAEIIKEENEFDLCSNQEVFSDNFLFNSISSALGSKKDGECFLASYSSSPNSVSPDHDSATPDSGSSQPADATPTHDPPVHHTHSQVVVFKGPVIKHHPPVHRLSGNQVLEPKGLAQDLGMPKPQRDHPVVSHTRSLGANKNQVCRANDSMAESHPDHHPKVTSTPDLVGGKHKSIQTSTSAQNLYGQQRTDSKQPDSSHQQHTQSQYKQETLV